MVNIVIPTGAGAVDVSTYVPIAEGIIVGGVPESFVEVPGYRFHAQHGPLACCTGIYNDKLAQIARKAAVLRGFGFDKKMRGMVL